MGPSLRHWKTLVVGVDLDDSGKGLSEGSRSALRQAEWISSRNPSAILLVHSTGVDHGNFAGEGLWDEQHEALSDERRTTLEFEVNRLCAAGMDARVAVRREGPSIALIKEAIERRADLVLLGKHEADLEGARMGAVTHQVLRKSPCPVWAVKPGRS
ncbi:MAG: universal stress protein, partial [Planctomycetota bacterium]